jgi:S1-C subfamily serine protease
MHRGSASSAAVGDSVTVIGHGGLEHALDAKIIARREFAGYWEYLLEEALFTAPAHPQWGGTALVGEDGKLLGVGSLLVQEAAGPDTVDANMFVPIDLLEPILEDMLKFGRPARSARPWLGLYATPLQGVLVVRGLAQGGPAQRAGVKLGDVLLEVAGEPVSDLAELFRKVWRVGPAGSEIAMTLARGRNTSEVRVTSADREDFLKKPRRH